MPPITPTADLGARQNVMKRTIENHCKSTLLKISWFRGTCGEQTVLHTFWVEIVLI